MIGSESRPAFSRSLRTIVELRGRALAELADEDIGVRRFTESTASSTGRSVHGVLGVAVELERDERRVRVLGDLTGVLRARGAEFVTTRRRETVATTSSTAARTPDSSGQRLALHQHGPRRPVEPSSRIESTARLTGRSSSGELLGSDRAADHDGGDDEREPSEDRDLPVRALQRPVRAARLSFIPGSLPSLARCF